MKKKYTRQHVLNNMDLYKGETINIINIDSNYDTILRVDKSGKFLIEEEIEFEEEYLNNLYKIGLEE